MSSFYCTALRELKNRTLEKKNSIEKSGCQDDYFEDPLKALDFEDPSKALDWIKWGWMNERLSRTDTDMKIIDNKVAAIEINKRLNLSLGKERINKADKAGSIVKETEKVR